MWLCNVQGEDQVGWETARLGKVAFWEGGVKIAVGLRPLFVAIAEVKGAGDHVGISGLVFKRVEQYVPHYCADQYELVRVQKEAIELATQRRPPHVPTPPDSDFVTLRG